MTSAVSNAYHVRGAKLRQLKGTDLAAALGLQEAIMAALPNSLWYVPSDPQDMGAVIGRGEAFGFFARERLVGYGVLSPWHVRGAAAYAGKLGLRAENTYDVRDVMVHPDFRRRGMQSAFLQLFEETARAMGGVALYATVDPGNQASIGGFEKAGFAHIKTQPAYDGRLRGYYCKRI